jgi:hypothetical protein
MAKRSSGETFRQDRDWSRASDLYDPPGPEGSMKEKIEYQRRLRQAWESMNDLPPSAILDFPMPDGRWYTHPYAPSPEYQRQQLKKQMARYERRTA